MDETTNLDPNPTPEKSLAEVAGVGQAEAAKAIADMNNRFAAQQAETNDLRRLVIAQQAQIEKMNAVAGITKDGKIAIIKRHCNSCGTPVEAGQRCPKPGHKNQKINEIGMGVVNNRMQEYIVRHV